VNAVYEDNHCSVLLLCGAHTHCVWTGDQVFIINLRYTNTKQEALNS